MQWNSLTDRTSVETLSLTETLTALTKPYSCVFRALRLGDVRSNSQDPTDSRTFPRDERPQRSLIMADQIPYMETINTPPIL